MNGIENQVFFNFADYDSFYGNIVYSAGEPSASLFYYIAPNVLSNSDYNLFFTPDSSKFTNQLSQWRALMVNGQPKFDVHSIVADPLFVDAAHDNYALQLASPAARPIGGGGIGFQPIDFTGLP